MEDRYLVPKDVENKPTIHNLNFCRVDFSNGLLSEKIKERAEKFNLQVPLSYDSSLSTESPIPPKVVPEEVSPENISNPVSNSLADRLGTVSFSLKGQNKLNKRYSQFLV